MNLKELRVKQNQLKDIQIQLKREFYGLDDIIDQLIDTLKPWYLFNEAQTHPLVINLWGLTGTGKTSLIKKLIQLLDKEQAFFRFELDDVKNKDFNSTLTNAVDVYEGEDYIICFDEFQHIRTIDQTGSETNNNLNFNLWDFIDTGEFEIKIRYYDKNDYLIQYNKLKAWISNGFKLNDGKIHFEEQPEPLKNYLKKYYKKTNETPVDYLWRDDRQDLFNLFKDSFKTILDFEKYYYSCDEKDLIKLIYEASIRKRRAEKGNMSKSLIFIVGNLDEAYRMSQDFNPDIHADAFYKLTKTIKIPHIKEALKQRFRNEQIARLGNNHIIYPALNKAAYQGIISKHLQQINTRFKNLYNIEFIFKDSVLEMLYNNSVYPTQGVRPLLSSLKTYIDANIGKILSFQEGFDSDVTQIVISYRSSSLWVSYFNHKKMLNKLQLHVLTDLDNIRQETDKNRQAVTSVHEAGHAVTSIALLFKIPSQVNSATVSLNQDGFSFNDDEQKLITKTDLVNIAAMCLGGLEAERLIFGEKLISLGSSSDLKKATELILKSLYENGMGSKTGYFSIENPRNKHALSKELPQLQKEAEDILNKAREVATACLTEERILLIKIAKSLCLNTSMDRMIIKTFIDKYGNHINLKKIEDHKNKQLHLDILRENWQNLPKAFLDPDEKLLHSFKKVLNK